MRAISKALWAGAMFLWCTGALASAARAEDSQWADRGLTARGGTAVGFADISDYRFTTLGGNVALGYRIGPVVLESEYEATEILRYTGLTNDLRGEMRRLGVTGRFYFARLGNPEGGASHFLLFVDAAAGRQKGLLEGRSFSRSDIGGGMGWLLDHQMDTRSASGIERVGWHFGWRLTTARRAPQAMARVVCGKHCPEPEPQSGGDLNLSVSSSLSLSW